MREFVVVFMGKKWIRSTGVILVSITLGLFMYNGLGAMGVENAEECWYQAMPSGDMTYNEFIKLNMKCGLKNSAVGTGIEGEYVEYSKSFTSIWLIYGNRREISVSGQLKDDGVVTSVRLSRGDGQN